MISFTFILFILSQILARNSSEQYLFAFIFAIFSLGFAIKLANNIQEKENIRKKYLYNLTK